MIRQNRRRRLGAGALMGAALAVGLLAGEARACGLETDCVLSAPEAGGVAGRVYRMQAPEGAAGPVGALVFAHGYRGKAANSIRNASLQAFAKEKGLALIALQAPGDDWSLPGVPGNNFRPEINEVAYVDAVIANAAARGVVDPERVVLSGFSAGGMLVWTVICARGAEYAGYIPVAGVFWRPEPTSCDGPPAHVAHVHGDADGIVPLAGRRIGDAHQGDVAQTLAMYAENGGYALSEQEVTQGEMRCQARRKPRRAAAGVLPVLGRAFVPHAGRARGVGDVGGGGGDLSRPAI